MISCMQARRLIHKGCQAFLASIISAPDVPTPSLSDVPVVREFPDVFPDDVTSLPPEREVELSIDLLPGTVPISKAPYRLAPAEMLELKQQIQELLDKEFETSCPFYCFKRTRNFFFKTSHSIRPNHKIFLTSF